MMGPRQEAKTALFYDFSIEDHVPVDHVLRAIDGVIDLSSVRTHLTEFYSSTGRPSVDPELMMRMLLVGWGTRYEADDEAGKQVTQMGRLPDLLHVTILREFRYVS